MEGRTSEGSEHFEESSFQDINSWLHSIVHFVLRPYSIVQFVSDSKFLLRKIWKKAIELHLKRLLSENSRSFSFRTQTQS